MAGARVSAENSSIVTSHDTSPLIAAVATARRPDHEAFPDTHTKGALWRIVVADDHPLYRDGIVRALQESGRYRVTGAAGNGEACLWLIERHRPDVALLDVRMPRLDGLGVLRRLRREGIQVPVLLLSAFARPELVRQAFANGAAGCLAKDVPRNDILAALDLAARGGHVAAEPRA